MLTETIETEHLRIQSKQKAKPERIMERTISGVKGLLTNPSTLFIVFDTKSTSCANFVGKQSKNVELEKPSWQG